MDMWYMCGLYWTLLLGQVTHDRCCQCLLVLSGGPSGSVLAGVLPWKKLFGDWLLYRLYADGCVCGKEALSLQTCSDIVLHVSSELYIVPTTVLSVDAIFGWYHVITV